MRKKGLILLLTMLICIVGIITVTSNKALAVHQEQSMQNSPSDQRAQVGGPGIAAIKPTHPGLTPAFTVNDVNNYLRTHTFVGANPIQGSAPVKNEVEFITSKEASQLMHGALTGLPDSAQVCYIKYIGSFTRENLSVPPGAKPLPPVQFGVEIYDAQTGNLLMTWTP